MEMTNKVGRPTKYDPKYCDMIVGHMAEGASITSFAAEIDVARSTITEWAENHPEFSAAVTRGKAKCAAWWERVARTNAVTGEGNATLTVFGLSNMAADDWRSRNAVDHTSSDGSMSPQPSIIEIVYPEEDDAETAH
jgi:hypothetical protein